MAPAIHYPYIDRHAGAFWEHGGAVRRRGGHVYIGLLREFSRKCPREKKTHIFQPRRSVTSELHRRSASVGRHVAGSGAACCVMARPCAAFLHDFQFSSMVNDANQFVARDLFGSSRAAHATKRALTRCSQAFRSLWATQMGGRHLGPWCWSGVSRRRKTIVMMCGYLAKEDVCPTPLGAQGGAAKANDQSLPVRRLLGPPEGTSA